MATSIVVAVAGTNFNTVGAAEEAAGGGGGSTSAPLNTGQTVEYTPVGATTKDDGGFAGGVARSYTLNDTGQYSGTSTVLGDAESNNTVTDNATGLMWQRNPSTSTYQWDLVGGNDIFDYCDAANGASLGGHTDWRVPTAFELITLGIYEGATVEPDPAYFPTFGVDLWTSTTRPGVTTNAFFVDFGNDGKLSGQLKTNVDRVLLVRDA